VANLIDNGAALGRRARARWRHRVPPADRLLLLTGVTIRAAGMLQIAYLLPLVWGRLPRPDSVLLLVVGLVLESILVIGWWFGRRGLDPVVGWLDGPTGVLVLGFGAGLVGPLGLSAWSLLAYPYFVLLSFGAGLMCRRLVTALGIGAAWAVANLVGVETVAHRLAADAVGLVLPFVIYPLVGWTAGRILRTNAAQAEEARKRAVRETAALATAVQRRRLETALHDRVLQTLETLARPGAMTGAPMQERAAELAGWLRRYVETGRVDHSGDIIVDLEAVARTARRAGIPVELNDARLREVTTGGELGPDGREALVEAAYETITAFGTGAGPGGGSTVVRVAPDGAGILVTVLASGGRLPPAEDIGDARSRLAAAGGRLSVEPGPYAELWVPYSPL
jgi:hypothetical protein